MRATAQLFPNTRGAVIRNPWASLPLLYYLQAGSPLLGASPCHGLRAADGRVWLGQRQPRDARCLGWSQGSHAQSLASAQPRIPNDGRISFSGAALAQPMDSDQSEKYTLKCTQWFSSPNPHRQTNPSAGELCLQPDSESPPGWARDVARGQSRRGDPEAGTHPAAQGGDAEGQSHPEPPAQAASTGPSPFLSISQTIS